MPEPVQTERNKMIESNKTVFAQYRISQKRYQELKELAKIMFYECKMIQRPTVAALARYCLYSQGIMEVFSKAKVTNISNALKLLPWRRSIDVALNSKKIQNFAISALRVGVSYMTAILTEMDWKLG
jgi:hypothetical protein